MSLWYGGLDDDASFCFAITLFLLILSSTSVNRAIYGLIGLNYSLDLGRDLDFDLAKDECKDCSLLLLNS